MNLRGKLAVLIAISVLIIVICIILLRMYYSREMSKAIAAGNEYIAQKYEQEMLFLDAFKNIDGLKYTMEYRVAKEQDFIFSIQVALDKKENVYVVWRDEYLDEMLKRELLGKYYPLVSSIWGKNTHASILMHQYISVVAPNLNEFSTIHDIRDDNMAKKYTLFIYIPYYFTQTEIADEAMRIYCFIDLLKQETVFPGRIAIERVADDSKGIEKTSSNTETCWIIDIDHISSLDDVFIAVDKYWFVDEKKHIAGSK